MAQNPLVIPSTGILSGLQLVLDINAAIASIATQNAGPTAPLDPVQYQVWYDTTTNTLMVYNGTKWVPQTNGASLSGIEVVTSNLSIGTPQLGLLLECQGATPLTLTLPNAADYLGSNVAAFNELTGGASVTITISPSGGSFIGLGASGTSYNLPANYVSQFISDGYDWIMIGSSGLAPVSGSTSNPFNVANATATTNALPLGQAQGLFAALNGSASQVFNAANAITNTEVVNLGQANGLYGQLAQSNTWSQRQIFNGGTTVPAQSGAITAGTPPSGAPSSFSQVALPSGYTNLIDSYYNGSAQVYKLDANGNVTISGGITLAGAISATGTASAAPATSSGELLQLGQIQNDSLSPSFVDGTFSGNVIVSGSVSGSPATSSGELLQLGQIQNSSLSPSFANGAFSGNVSAGNVTAASLTANASLTTKTASVSGTITQAAGTGTNNETPFAQYGDLFADAILSGLTTTTSSTLSGTLAPGVAAVLGQRVPYAGSAYTVAASTTSYLDLSNAGVLTVSTSSTVTANSLRLWSVTSNATAITAVAQVASIPSFNQIIEGATPPQFDVSTKVATTAFVQQMAGNFSGFTISGITGSGTGTVNSHIGNILYTWPIVGLTTQLGPQAWGSECQLASAVANTITYLPENVSGYFGSAILFKNDSNYPQIIAVNTTLNPSAFIYAPVFGLGTTNTQIVLKPGENIVILSRGINENDVINGTFLSYGYTEGNAKSVGSTTTAGDVTLTAAQLDAGFFADSATQTANYTFTTDTATNILAAVFPIIVGGAFRFRFINNDQSSSGYTATLVAGTGVTLSTVLHNPAIGKGGWADYLFTCTANGATPTFTVAPIGGTASGLL